MIRDTVESMQSTAQQSVQTSTLPRRLDFKRDDIAVVEIESGQTVGEREGSIVVLQLLSSGRYARRFLCVVQMSSHKLNA